MRNLSFCSYSSQACLHPSSLPQGSQVDQSVWGEMLLVVASPLPPPKLTSTHTQTKPNQSKIPLSRYWQTHTQKDVLVPDVSPTFSHSRAFQSLSASDSPCPLKDAILLPPAPKATITFLKTVKVTKDIGWMIFSWIIKAQVHKPKLFCAKVEKSTLFPSDILNSVFLF